MNLCPPQPENSHANWKGLELWEEDAIGGEWQEWRGIVEDKRVIVAVGIGAFIELKRSDVRK
jgi:hypothetical protein